MIRIDRQRTPVDLERSIERLFELSGAKIRALDRRWGQTSGAPVFTVGGKYQSRGWTDWTEGFQFGSALLQYDATGEAEFLDIGRGRTLAQMTPHLTHTGVHDHGFNTVSTYGALWRLARRRARRRAGSGRAGVRAGAQGERGRAGRSLDAAAGRRVHPLVQRRPLALRGHDPLPARAGARARARAHADGGAGCAREPARSPAPARERHGAIQRVLRPRARRLRRPGRVAHEAVFNVVNGSFRNPSTHQGTRRSRRGRAVSHGRSWGSPSSSNSSKPCPTTCSASGEGVPRSTDGCSKRRAPRPTITCPRRPPPTACRIGIPARPGSRRSGDWGEPAGGSLQRP